jgi:hypothetical protein
VKNEARSHSHRWVVEPDRVVQIGDEFALQSGNVIRQRLTAPVKPGWRLATWDEIDSSDPSTAEAFDYKREQEAKEPASQDQRAVVYRDGVPDARPVLVEAPQPAPPALDVSAFDEGDI